MAEKEYRLDEFLFESRTEYERALKEKETIAQIRENLKDNHRELLKLYNKSITKGAFQTIYGYDFLRELREKLIADGTVAEDVLSPVPVKNCSDGGVAKLSTDASAKEIRKYKVLYNDVNDKNRILKMAIGFLLAVIIAMLVITLQSKYTVFTYFTDYEDEIRIQIEDEYEEWQADLEEREKKVEEKENQLGIAQE